MVTGVSNIIAQLFTFVVGAIYARVLGKDSFGTITLVQAMLIYFATFSMFGLQTYGTREISKDMRDVERIAGEILSIRTIMASISFITIYIITALLNKDLNFKVVLILYGFTLFPQVLTFDWLFNGLEEMHHNAVYSILKSLVPLVLVIVFLSKLKIIFLIPIFTLAGLLISMVYQLFILLIVKKYKIKFKINKSIIIKYIHNGYPFFIAGLLAMVNNYMDRIIIGFTRTSAETGLYSAAYYLIMFMINIVAIIYTPLFPQYVKMYKENNLIQLQSFSEKCVKYISFIALPIAFGGIVLSKEIILLLFGSEYLASTLPFSILFIYILILFFREIYGYQLNAWNCEKIYLSIVGISAISNLFLNLILTPKFGMTAAACITVITEIINLLLMRRSASKIIDIQLFKFMKNAFLPTVLMVLITLILKILKLYILIIIPISIISYVLILFKSNCISTVEIKSLLFDKSGE